MCLGRGCIKKVLSGNTRCQAPLVWFRCVRASTARTNTTGNLPRDSSIRVSAAYAFAMSTPLAQVAVEAPRRPWQKELVSVLQPHNDVEPRSGFLL